MKDKPDVRDFMVSGDSGDPAASASESIMMVERESVMVKLVAPKNRVQKMFRLRWELSAALKQATIQESEEQDRRISETEIVEKALKKYLHKYLK